MKRLLLLFFLLPLLAYGQEKLEEHWYSLLLDGKSAGYMHRTSWKMPGGRVQSVIEQSLRIRRFGVPFALTQTDLWIEDGRGALLSLSSRLDMNGQRRGVEVRETEAGLQVRASQGGQTQPFLLPVEGEVRGVYAIDGEIRSKIGAWKMPGGPAGRAELLYRQFSPESLEVDEVRLRILGRGQLQDSVGGMHRGILVEERSSGLPGVVTTAMYDREGFLYSRTTAGLALEVLRLDSSPEEPGGAKEDEAAVFDVASLTVAVRGLPDVPPQRLEAVTVLFRGPGTAALERALIELGRDGEDGNGQASVVSSRRDERGQTEELVVRLRRPPPPDAALSDPQLPPAQALPPEAAAYMGGGLGLDLEDPRLEQLLAHCRSTEKEGVAGARCLERLVNEFIENKSLAYGFAGVKEILAGRAGDCTEHALLLAALLRKAGFPSRLAWGMLLTESGFIGHAWTEMFTSEGWRALDPSFPGASPYGLKIRLGVMNPARPVWSYSILTLLEVARGVDARLLEAEQRR